MHATRWSNCLRPRIKYNIRSIIIIINEPIYVYAVSSLKPGRRPPIYFHDSIVEIGYLRWKSTTIESYVVNYSKAIFV